MQSTAAEATPPTFELIPLEQLRESKDNPRKHYDQAALLELAESIRGRGIITPLLVRPVTTESGFVVAGVRPVKFHYEIAAGHRRYRAAKLAAVPTVPAIVRTMSDVEFLEVLTVENLQREDLHPLEAAEGYQALVTRGGYDVAAIAAKVGKSTGYVYTRLKLIELIPAAKKAYFDEHLELGHALLLARLQPEQQRDGLTYARRGANYTIAPADLARHIRDNILCELTSATFDTTDATLVPAVGACGPCPHRGGNQPGLFAEVAKGDKCLAPTCFRAKVVAHLERVVAGVQAETKKKPVRISLNYQPPYGTKRAAGVVYRGDQGGRGYRTIKADGCEHAEQAVVVDGTGMGNEDTTLGTVLTICRSKSCRKGEPQAARSAGSRSSGSADHRKASAAQKAATAKRTAEEAGKLAVLDAILGKVPKAVSAAELRVVARALYDMCFDEQAIVAGRHGWGQAPKDDPGQSLLDRLASYRNYEAAALRGIDRLSPNELGRLIVELALMPCVTDTALLNSGNGLETLAKHHKLNVAKIVKEAAAKLAPPPAASTSTATKKKSKTPAKKKAKR